MVIDYYSRTKLVLKNPFRKRNIFFYKFCFTFFLQIILKVKLSKYRSSNDFVLHFGLTKYVHTLRFSFVFIAIKCNAVAAVIYMKFNCNVRSDITKNDLSISNANPQVKLGFYFYHSQTRWQKVWRIRFQEDTQKQYN